MKICITGGSGFIGTKLTEALGNRGHEILILDRTAPRFKSNKVSFIPVDLLKNPVPREVLSCDAIINLAGVNIFGRWTRRYKQLIMDSRVKTTSALVETLKKAEKRPKVFINASAVGYYGDKDENELDESSPAGNDFLASVCVKWEKAAREAQNAGIRTAIVRTGVVLGSNGGALRRLVPVFKLGAGGPIGTGKQWFSWIHINDIVNTYITALFNDNMSGPINAVSPNPVRNKDFAKTLGKVLKRPAILTVPKFALRLALGELADAVVMSQKAVPKKLLDGGFAYTKPDLEEALASSIYD